MYRVKGDNQRECRRNTIYIKQSFILKTVVETKEGTNDSNITSKSDATDNTATGRTNYGSETTS